MAGLLYKDFVAMRGKRFVLVITILTFVYIIFRMLFPGNSELEGFMIRNEDGETVNLIDSFFFIGEFYMLWFGCYFINTWGQKIITTDNKIKIRSYLLSMPFSKKNYVASKYIFVATFAYAIFSIYVIWHVVSLAFMGDSFNKDFSYFVTGFSIPLVCLTLFVTAIEMPMFLIWGKGKAMMVKVTIIMAIGIAAIGYVFFGNLNVFEQLDIWLLIKWAEAHEIELTLLSVLSPMFTILFYYLSYRIALKFYEKKEEYDEY